MAWILHSLNGIYLWNIIFMDLHIFLIQHLICILYSKQQQHMYDDAMQ